jgi:hypothetical protein
MTNNPEQQFFLLETLNSQTVLVRIIQVFTRKRIPVLKLNADAKSPDAETGIVQIVLLLVTSWPASPVNNWRNL